ncbi:MAG TPA: hypothetical protein VJC06_02890 [Candidatus Paceibacterota bacterium]
MLDRITELEGQLYNEFQSKHQALAVLWALQGKILKDKQKFRSPTSQEIRANILFALTQMGIKEGDIEVMSASEWSERFSQLGVNVVVK